MSPTTYNIELFKESIMQAEACVASKTEKSVSTKTKKPRSKKRNPITADTMIRLALDKAGYGFITTTEPKKEVYWEDDSWKLQWVRTGNTEWTQILFGKTPTTKHVLKTGRNNRCKQLGLSEKEIQSIWDMKTPKDKFQRVDNIAQIVHHPQKKFLVQMFLEFEVEHFLQWERRYSKMLTELNIRRRFYRSVSMMIKNMFPAPTAEEIKDTLAKKFNVK